VVGGIDGGLTIFAMLSTGEEQALAKAHRRLSTGEKRRNRHAGAQRRQVVARVQERTRWGRSEFPLSTAAVSSISWT